MNRIARKFRQLRAARKKALIIYVTAGFPDMGATRDIVLALDKNGADMVELGVPFSDPIADGPIIQGSSQKALEKGVSLRKIFGLVRALRRETGMPLLLMSYLNPVNRYGAERFFADCAGYGIDGVIIPDLIVEEGKELEKAARNNGVGLVYFVAPTSGPARRKAAYAHASGFVYVVSVSGITGPRKSFSPELKGFLSKIRRETKAPLSLGFGISDPGQVRPVLKYIDGFIIGSAFIKLIAGTRRKDLAKAAGAFARKFSDRQV